MNESGVYVGVVAEVNTGFELGVFRYKNHCPKCNDRRNVQGIYCPICATELIKPLVRCLKDYHSVLENAGYSEDLFYELPVETANKKGVVYLVSNLYNCNSQIDTTQPTEIAQDLIDRIILAFALNYKLALDFLATNGFNYQIKFMAVKWAEY